MKKGGKKMFKLINSSNEIKVHADICLWCDAPNDNCAKCDAFFDACVYTDD